MSPRAELRAGWRTAAARWLPALLITILGLALLWPVPLGRMPLSADHTVHLTRAWLIGQFMFERGQLSGWSELWFFGFPAGELYPPLGDLAIAGLHGLGLGLLSWERCYAWVLTLVFLLQGWSLLRAGRALALGPWPGLVAAALALVDVGAYREGGWIYTIFYGVWPQALATSLVTLAIAELLLCSRASGDLEDMSNQAGARRRHLALAGLYAGLALLAHPMSMLVLAGAGLAFTLVIGLSPPRRRPPEARPQDRRHPRLVRALLHAGVGLGLGLGLAAWWLLPMLAHRGWMASYGWLYAPLELMAKQVLERGRWAHFMPALAGQLALAAVVYAALLGRRALRLVALLAVTLWALASVEALWTLRLDWLSEGFTHIQYQRFLTAAKPWLFLLTGAGIGLLVELARALWRGSQPQQDSSSARRLPRFLQDRRLRLALAVVTALSALALAAGVAQQARAITQKHWIPLQLERDPTRPELAADYAAFLDWARAQRAASERPYRIAFKAPRNSHWFMDAPVYTDTPVYKLGFTPGDNFVHKPEVGGARIFDQLGVRYVITRGARSGGRGTTEVARFGDIRVHERDVFLKQQRPVDMLAHLEGPGALEWVEGLPGEGLVRLRVTEGGGNSTPAHKPVSPRAQDDPSAPTWLITHIAGHPRWRMRQGDTPLEWVELPVLAPRHGAPALATQADRREGRLRGGKAHGDDGTEPTVMAAALQPGGGDIELRYVRWLPVDIIGLLISALSALALGLLGLAGARASALLERLETLSLRLLRPWVLATVALLLTLAVGLRWSRGYAREQVLASAQLPAKASERRAIAAGPLKTDMLIYPALVVERARKGDAALVLESVPLGETLRGWYAIDDDDAKGRRKGSHQLELSVRAPGEEWRTLVDTRVPHRPGRNHLALPTQLPAGAVGDLRARVRSEGKAPPRLGFNFNFNLDLDPAEAR